MSSFPEPETPPLALGMTSLTLGTIGLVLCVFPILGLPISMFALLFGLIGLAASLLRQETRLRWSAAGLALSSVALAINLAITFASTGYLPRPDVTPMWQGVPDRPSVSPPA